MSTIDNDPTTTSSWSHVVLLLFAAADRGFAEAAGDPHRHSTAMGAYTTACVALSLLPKAALIDTAEIPAGDMATLIRAADRSIEDLPATGRPPGAGVVIRLVQALADEVPR
jgi:hypothetical protein